MVICHSKPKRLQDGWGTGNNDTVRDTALLDTITQDPPSHLQNTCSPTQDTKSRISYSKSDLDVAPLVPERYRTKGAAWAPSPIHPPPTASQHAKLEHRQAHTINTSKGWQEAPNHVWSIAILKSCWTNTARHHFLGKRCSVIRLQVHSPELEPQFFVVSGSWLYSLGDRSFSVSLLSYFWEL